MAEGLTATLDEWLVRIRSAMGRGEYLLAYDRAIEAREAHPDDAILQYVMVLALARAGATDQAVTTLEAFDLEARAEDESLALQEDVAALRARLAKDGALSVGGEERRRRARHATQLYEAVYRRLGRSYACINAATMALVAGDPAHSAELARAARDLSRETVAIDPLDAYWSAATEAEAALLLGDVDGAAEALARASSAVPDLAAVASTRRQLLLVTELMGIDDGVLDALAVPTVIHFGGHMISAPGEGGRFPAKAESTVAAAIRAYLDESAVGFGFGSLACGADILFAEALLERGAELHVVLPFAADEFKVESVARGGATWQARFDRCLAEATTVTCATTGAYLGDDSLYGYCARIAMGHARIRAEFLAAPVEQVIVWDGGPAAGAAGTASDVAVWQAAGLRTHVIPVGELDGHFATSGSDAPPSRRVLRAMLFADLRGFSRLSDAQMAAFVSGVMAPLAATLDRFDDDILHRNRWGDGLHVVLSNLPAAAHCALALQDTMRSIRLDELCLPATLGLRIGAHVGPVFEGEDPVRKERSFYGVEVTRTARIEPRTPVGSVYVTDSFAALTVLEDAGDLSCQYVGHIPTAKDYGTFPMYVLRRRA